ncbi:unnamed protein product, partial [Prorocentrum cordatum]
GAAAEASRTRPPTTCKWWLKGTCKFGDDCRYSHRGPASPAAQKATEGAAEVETLAGQPAPSPAEPAAQEEPPTAAEQEAAPEAGDDDPGGDGDPRSAFCQVIWCDQRAFKSDSNSLRAELDGATQLQAKAHKTAEKCIRLLQKKRRAREKTEARPLSVFLVSWANAPELVDYLAAAPHVAAKVVVLCDTCGARAREAAERSDEACWSMPSFTVVVDHFGVELPLTLIPPALLKRLLRTESMGKRFDIRPPSDLTETSDPSCPVLSCGGQPEADECPSAVPSTPCAWTFWLTVGILIGVVVSWAAVLALGVLRGVLGHVHVLLGGSSDSAQVLVHCPNDEGGMFWRHRTLVKKVTAGVWIAITPDLAVVRHNLLEQRHLVLDRNVMFPADRRAEVYGFDPVPRAEILALKRQAAVQAAMLGDGDHGVGMELMQSRTWPQSKGAALANGLEVFIEKVQGNQLQEWKAARSSEGEDLRTLGDHRDSAGRRHLPLSDAASLMRETSVDDWAMPGPRVAKEWLVSVRDGPGDLTSYHGQWVRRSGVSESSAVAHVHYVLCESVRLAIRTDQLGVTNLPSSELIMRRICQDETAVARNPRHPDYGGLKILLRAPTTEQGQASTNRFTEWVTGRLEEQAAIYRQTRLWNEEQRAMQNGYWTALRSALPLWAPPPPGLTAEGAARELLASKGLYCQEPKNLAPFDLTKLKVAKGRARPRSVANLLPPLPADMIRNPALYIEKDQGEMEFMRQHTDPIRPYWDPVLRSSRTERWRLFRVLYELGLITFRRRLRARAALVFVKKKKPGEIRMIVGARQANSRHRAPPTSRLGSAGALADLDLSVGGESVDGVGSAMGWDPRGNEADVEDCFYNFAVDGLAEWFGFDDPLPAAEIRDTYGINVGAFWDPELSMMVSVEDDMVLYPCMRAMCMGWSWALYFAQEAVSAMTERALRSPSLPTPAMVKEHHPAPDLRESKVMGSVYVAEADRSGLPITWSYPDVVTHLETVGVEIDLKKGKLRNKASRVWRIDLATRALLRRGKMRGGHMEVWLGHAVSLLMLARPGYAAPSATCRFAEVARGVRTPLPREVMHEMRLVVGLVWLAEVDLAAPYVPRVYASDSADNGHGLMYKRASDEEMQSAFRWKERWSFKQHLRGPRVGLTSAADVAEMGGYREVDEAQLDYEVEPRCRSAEPSAGSDPATAFGQWLQSRGGEGSASAGSHRPRPRRLRRRPVDPGGPDAECLSQAGPLAPPLPASWFDPEGFKLVAARRWRWPGEHIYVKENRDAVMGLRHACRVRQNCGRRLISLVDSMACVGCLDKGRPSRSAALNAQCRRAAAYTIGCRVRWRLQYVNTKFNVADAPSRRFEHNSPDKGHPPAAAESDKHLGPQPPEDQGFLELFSGEGGLSRAFEELGLSTRPCVDIKDGAHHDLLDPKVQNIILEDIRKGRFWYVHLGTPCCVWSRARHGIVNYEKAAYKERVGVALALFSCRVAYECSRNGVFWSIENPRSSRLWDFDPVRELTDLPDVVRVCLVRCSYGASHMKPTAILTNLSALSSLAPVCSRDHSRVELGGFETVTLPSGARVSRNRAAGAGAYPRSLCQAWALAAGMSAPAVARNGPDAPDGGDLEARLRDAARRPASRARERLRPARQRLQAEPDLGLAGAADSDGLESRYDHLRPFIVFGQDSNLEAIKGRNLSFGPRAPVPADGGAARFGSITSTSLERYGAAVREFFEWAKRSDDLRQAPESFI